MSLERCSFFPVFEGVIMQQQRGFSSFSLWRQIVSETFNCLFFLECIDHVIDKNGLFDMFSVFLNHATFACIWGPLSENNQEKG